MSDQEAVQARESAVIESSFILAEDGRPFRTANAAGTYRSTRYNKDSHEIVRVEGGFALKPTSVEQRAQKMKDAAGKDSEEKVFKVRIRPASDNITKNARMAMPGCNGEMLWLRRGQTYPVPERFLRSMDATLHPQSRHVVGSDRMETMWVQDDQYDILGESSWEEYRKWAAETDYGKNDVVR
jgi:hypothetical protein